MAAGLLAALFATPAHAQERGVQQALSITKDADQDTFTFLGELVGYTYEVTNQHGFFTVEDIVVIDDKVDNISCDVDDLGPGDSATCTGTYEILQGDIDDGFVTNTAHAEGCLQVKGCIQTESNEVQETIFFDDEPSISLAKEANPDSYATAGTLITYTYTVTNTGNVPVDTITVEDDLLDPDPICPATTLQPGDDLECTATYTTTEDDVANQRNFFNTAVAHGQSDGCDDSARVCFLDSNPASAFVTFDDNPSISLDKDANPTSYTLAGTLITYTYTVTNTGNVPVDSVTVEDDQLDPDPNCPATTLQPGDELICTGTYTTTDDDVDDERDIVNTAIAHGQTPSCGKGEGGCFIDSNEATATVTFEPPPALGSITIVKQATGGDGSFGFASDNQSIPDFTLTTEGGSASRTFSNLDADIYVITEVDLPPDWELAALECTGDLPKGTPTSTNEAERSASIGLDSGEAIVCTFDNTFNAPPSDDTDDVIAKYLQNRVDRLAEDPDRSRIFRRLAGSVWGDDSSSANAMSATGALLAFSGRTENDGTNFSASTSLQQIVQAYAALGTHGTQLPPPSLDVWVEMHYSDFEDDGGSLDSEGHFGVVYAGADYLVTPSVLIGALVQMDWDDQSIGTPEDKVEGHGWMAGPYVSARLLPSLFFDARAAWGQSDNTIEMFGQPEDDFDTNRWLASAKLTGNWTNGNFRVTPSLGVIYVEENQDDFVTSGGVLVEDQTASLGRVSFGPEFAYRFVGADGGHIEPQLSITGLWDFDDSGTVTVGGLSSENDDFRAKLEAGFLARTGDGFSLRVVGTYDGIGSDLEAYGGQFWVNVPLR